MFHAGTSLLDVAYNEIDEQSFDAKHLPDAGHDYLRDAGLGDDLGDDVGEILDHYDDARAAVGELMLEFARGVERVDVDHGAAGTKDTEQAHRVLQHIGHHQRDAVALLESPSLQVRAERARFRVELGEG